MEPLKINSLSILEFIHLNFKMEWDFPPKINMLWLACQLSNCGFVQEIEWAKSADNFYNWGNWVDNWYIIKNRF